MNIRRRIVSPSVYAALVRMETVGDLEEERRRSAAAARNCRRRMRRGGRGRCYRCHFGAPCNAGCEHVYRSRMNPQPHHVGAG